MPNHRLVDGFPGMDCQPHGGQRAACAHRACDAAVSASAAGGPDVRQGALAIPLRREDRADSCGVGCGIFKMMPEAFAKAGQFRFHGFHAGPLLLGEFLLRPSVEVMHCGSERGPSRRETASLPQVDRRHRTAGVPARLLPLLETFVQPVPAARPARVIDDLAADETGQPRLEGFLLADDLRMPQAPADRRPARFPAHRSRPRRGPARGCEGADRTARETRARRVHRSMKDHA